MKKLIFTIGLLSMGLLGQAQSLLPQIPEVNGIINSVVTDGDTAYLAGVFNNVFTKDSAVLYCGQTNANTGLLGSKNYAVPNGAVTASIADGKGGVYLAGNFSAVGDSARTGICHLDSSGKVTAALRNFGVGNTVSALDRYGDTLFIAGNFLKSGPNYYANPFGLLINLNNYAPSNVVSKINGNIMCSVADGKGGWFLGGEFKMINGQNRSGLARIDSNGNLYAFNPNVNGYIRGMILKGDTLFAGGSFSFAGGMIRNNLVALNIHTGAALAWNPNPNGEIWVLESGVNTLYVAGTFNSISGNTRQAIAAYQMSTLNLKTWSLTLNTNGSIYALCVAGNKIYIGGDFTTVKSTSRNKLACLDTAATAGLRTWNPNPNNAVFAIAFKENKLFVGGSFTTVNGQSRSQFVILDTSNTLSILSPNYALNGPMGYLVVKDDFLYGCGYFTSVNGTPKSRVFEFQISTNTFTPFNYNFTEGVSHCAVSANKILFSFRVTTFGGTNTNGLIGVYVPTGNLIFSPSPNYEVKDIKVANGKLYAVGQFTSVSATARFMGASWDLNTLTLNGFNPNFNNLAQTIVVDTDSSVYVGGAFTFSNTTTTNFMAKLNGNTGAVIPGFTMNAGGSISSMAIVGGRLWVSGNFNVINGQTRAKFAVLNKVTGAPVSFSTHTPNQEYKRMWTMGNQVWAVGDFSGIGFNYNLAGAVIIDTLTQAPTTWKVFSIGPVNTLCPISNRILVGSSNYINGERAENLIKLNVKTGKIVPNFKPSTNQEINKILRKGNQLFAIGVFTTANGINRNGVAAFDCVTGALKPWNPVLTPTNASVYGITENADGIFLAGYFFSVNGVSRTMIAEVDTLNGATRPFAPSVGNGPGAILFSNNKLYVLGNFSSAGSPALTRNYACAFNYPSGTLSNWNPNFSGGMPYNMQLVRNKLYIWGDFSTVGGVSARFGVHAFDTINGAIIPPINSFNSRVTGFVFANNQLNIMGNFSSVNGIYYQGFVRMDTLNNVVPWGFKFTSTSSSRNWLAYHPLGLMVFTEYATLNNETATGFSMFGEQVVLPVKWGDFSVRTDENQEKAYLNWTTISEKNNAHFQVQRSLNGQDFDNISYVKGAGNSNLKLNYSFSEIIDKSWNGPIYYRLVQVDLDGKLSYSPIRLLYLNENVQVYVYPNPSQGQLHIQSQVPLKSVTITDLSGKVIGLPISMVGQSQSIETKDLNGLYILKVALEDGKEAYLKVLIHP